MKNIICPNNYEEILMQHPWSCFLCKPNAKTLNKKIIKVREDWKTRILNIYKLEFDNESSFKLEHSKSKKKIRVLSLFDGISTGKVYIF